MRLLQSRPEFVMGTLVLVLVLVISAVRTDGFAVTVGAEAAPAVAAEAAEDRPWFGLGEEVWLESCYGCHADLTYIPELFNAENGRLYLKEFMLFGLRGEVVIEGAPMNLRHRPFAHFEDEELAAVLNYMLVAWGNEEQLPPDTEFYTPEEVAEAREPERTNEEVLERRPNPWE
jgi:mono/diheme cytochrome c family protein